MKTSIHSTTVSTTPNASSTAKTPPSLVWRAAWSVVAAFAAVFVLLLAYIYYSSLKRDSGELDVALMRASQGFVQAIDPVDDAAEATSLMRLIDRMNRAMTGPNEPPSHVALRRRDGSQQLNSADTPAIDWSALADGVSEHHLGDERLRVYVASGQRWRVALIDHTDGRRQQLLHEVARDLALYLALAMPVLLLPILLSLRAALAPLRRLASTVAKRSPSDTTALSTHKSYRELQPLQQALNQQFARAAQSIQRERAFVHDAAHELRTPLAVISAQAHVLARSEGGARVLAQQQLEGAVTRASHLTHQLLRLAQADAVAQRARVALDLMNLLRDALSTVAERASGQGTELSLQGADHLSLASDAQALRSIIDNLLDNALRYGGPGGQVAVQVRSEGKRVHISVSDSGPGIASALAEQVFERFWRGPGVTQPGTGLGLAIAREAARSLGGDVRVRSGLPGQGCTVVVQLTR